MKHSVEKTFTIFLPATNLKFYLYFFSKLFLMKHFSYQKNPINFELPCLKKKFLMKHKINSQIKVIHKYSTFGHKNKIQQNLVKFFYNKELNFSKHFFFKIATFLNKLSTGRTQNSSASIANKCGQKKDQRKISGLPDGHLIFTNLS